MNIEKNKLFQKILAEELDKQVKLYEASEVNIWKTLSEKAREAVLLSLDPKYGDDLAEEYTNSNWDEIPSDVQLMISKVFQDINNVYVKANIARLYMKYQDKLSNIDVNGSKFEYLINTIRNGSPSPFAIISAITELINIHAINGFTDPELTRKPKEQQQRPNMSNGSNINGPRGFSNPDWRGSYKGD